MKLLKTILSTVILLLLLPAVQLSAQSNREMRPLDAHDFKCLQSLECIQSSESLKAKGWSFIFDDSVEKFAQELTATMEGKNISFFAIYDKDGILIESVYKRKNIALPALLLAHLAETEMENSRLTSTEMVMKNFDASTISYNVVLERNSSLESKTFDMAFINSIHLNTNNFAEN